MKLLFTNDWLHRGISSDPDLDIEAGPNLGESVMSWNFTSRGTTKQEVLDAFKEDNLKNPYCPFPDAVFAAGIALADRFGEEQVKSINTYGHINPDGSGKRCGHH